MGRYRVTILVEVGLRVLVFLKVFWSLGGGFRNDFLILLWFDALVCVILCILVWIRISIRFDFLKWAYTNITLVDEGFLHQPFASHLRASTHSSWSIFPFLPVSSRLFSFISFFPSSST